MVARKDFEIIVATRSCYPDSPTALRRRLLNSVAARSLRSQSDKDFIWVIHVYENDTSWRDVDGINVLFVPHAVWPKTIESLGGRHKRMVRFDDDDALSKDFIERLRNAGRYREGRWHTFPYGYRYLNGYFFKKKNWPNQFVSLDVNSGTGHHVYEINHRDIEKPDFKGNVAVVDDKPAWLWVRHLESKSEGGKQELGDRVRDTVVIDGFDVDLNGIR